MDDLLEIDIPQRELASSCVPCTGVGVPGARCGGRGLSGRAVGATGVLGISSRVVALQWVMLGRPGKIR